MSSGAIENPAGPPATAGAAASAGEIFDLGYRSYTGARLGRWYAVRSLTIQSLRTAFGLGRGAKAKLAPFSLLLFAMLPAVGSITMAAMSGNAVTLIQHEQYFALTDWLVALFCASQASELVGGDQQHRVLSLYFARAMHRSDYILAKLAALVIALMSIAMGPQIFLLVGRAFVNENPMQLFVQEADQLLPIFGSSLLISVLFASLSLLIASVMRRRVIAVPAIIGVLLLTSGVAGAMVRINNGSLRYTVLASPMMVGDGLTKWLFDTPVPPRSALGKANFSGATYGATALLLSGAAVGLLVLRYRRIRT